MAINAPYFLDAANLTSATSVYLDSDLTYFAPDGFYKNGTVVRQQVSGVLLSVGACAACATPCGTSIAGDGGSGIYLIDLDTGTDVGAIIVKFNPESIPDGIRVVYNGTVFNKLSSPVDGVHQSSNAGNFTIVGETASDCGLTGNTTVLPTLTEYLYDSAISDFTATGNTESVTILPGDVSLGTPPGFCVMVIPKPTVSPNIVNIEVVGPCPTTGWLITAECPAALPSFPSSNVNGSMSIPCSEPMPYTHYFAKVHTGTDTYVGLYDFVFSDANGQYPLANGWYLTSNADVTNKVIRVINGVVTAITNCI